MALDFNVSEYEIIIVDNGSKDNTNELSATFINEYPKHNIRYYYDEIPGLLTGRHKGAAEANGEILSFIDDDVKLDATWLKTIIEVMGSQREITFLTGPNLPLYESDPPSWIEYFWKKAYNGKYCGWLSLMDLGNEPIEIDPNFVWGLNFTIRKSAFIELGGFHPDNIPSKYQMFQGDGETGLTVKGREKGMKALYHPKVLLYHEVPNSRMTFEYFDKRAFYQGVCNSFSTIRRNAKLNNEAEIPLTNKKITLRNLVNYSKKVVNGILNKFVFKSTNETPSEVQELKKRFTLKTEEGFEFHQKQFTSNKLVKDWVLKENYFDYKIPGFKTDEINESLKI